MITRYKKNKLVTFKANPDYQGLLGKPARPTTSTIKYYADASNLKLDIQQGNIDVAFRSLSRHRHRGPQEGRQGQGRRRPRRRDPLHHVQLRHAAVRRQDGRGRPGQGARRPPGRRRTSSTAQAIADQVYKGTYRRCTPTFPTASPAPTSRSRTLYGDGNGKPTPDKAKEVLADAGVTTPVALNLQYNPDHYGPSSGDEYAMIKDQLEKSGLFKVNLQSTEWVTVLARTAAPTYTRLYQLGWFPDYS